ncbi:FAD-binding dehydrogenase [Amylibacter sp. SFDW26]|uniref:FAD-dependent tricarballylate dehydrogenase TcuA n=1 Tax=Amylibacter sp. SFDW26 TaxID=2652722 RepID=UPI001261FD92|nr:FAD-dependent tricarballylate dehydrogenase TcuA [Amylibacter sp. SFDW26]KAB7610503.1 FAD-binding dehydrogenase [Amylibacter sp. SFDW26]
MQEKWDVLIVGSGNAALCAGISACENGAKTLVIEKADQDMSGGNTKYTAGAMRFVYNGNEDLYPLLENPNDPRIKDTEFGRYTADKFRTDLLNFNDGRALSSEQNALIDESYAAMKWLAGHGVKYDPIYERQSFMKDGKYVFWGGLTLAACNEGVGLFDMELAAYQRLGGTIIYNTAMTSLIVEDGCVCGVNAINEKGESIAIKASSVILACGGFEANSMMRQKYIGPDWDVAKVRGTPHNTGDGLSAAFELDAKEYGLMSGCHATPMDLHMADYGNLNIPHNDRKNYRKICYFLGVMLNANGERFVDEGKDFRNYTYAQFGKAVLEQPGHFAWQIFDSKIFDLFYGEYRFHDAHYIEAKTLEELIKQLDGVDQAQAEKTLIAYNQAIGDGDFDPTIKDGKSTIGLELPKSNWAQKIDKGPFRAYPVTGGITFTYGGLKVSETGCVQNTKDQDIQGLYACGELVGGVFYNGYPGGSGLTSGLVFGRRAGHHASAN